MSTLQQLNQELANANVEIKRLLITKRDLDEQIADLEDHLKHLPDDTVVKRQLKALRKRYDELQTSIRLYSDQASCIRKEIDNATIGEYRREIEDEANDYHFDIPDDDPITHCLMLSAIAENLQYQYVSGKRFFHKLIDRVHKRVDEQGNDKGYTDEDALNPEIDYDDIAKLDDMRNKRRYLQVLRIAVERDFNKAMEDWPTSANFTPRLLRRTDEEMEAYLDGLKARRAGQRKSQAYKVAEAEHKLAETEDKAYTGE